MDDQTNQDVYAVLGGDQRFVELSNLLSYAGKKVFAFGFDMPLNFASNVIVCSDISAFLKKCKVIVLPLPISKDKINLYAPFSRNQCPLANIYAEIKESPAAKSGFVFGGKISPAVIEDANDMGINIKDYLLREDFAVYNAVPTAEGAIQIAMEQLPKTISSCRVLILGFGRISSVLVKMLNGFGSQISVCARKSHQLAWAQIARCHTFSFDFLEQEISGYDIIFNTIPSIILSENLLCKIKKDVLIIDLASAPGGINSVAAKTLKVNVINAQSLPGKVAPVTSGKIIMDVIDIMCHES